jgi:hypothetical protein
MREALQYLRAIPEFFRLRQTHLNGIFPNYLAERPGGQTDGSTR